MGACRDTRIPVIIETLLLGGYGWVYQWVRCGGRGTYWKGWILELADERRGADMRNYLHMPRAVDSVNRGLVVRGPKSQGPHVHGSLGNRETRCFGTSLVTFHGYDLHTVKSVGILVNGTNVLV